MNKLYDEDNQDKVFIYIHYNNRDLVKRLGCKWSSEWRLWYFTTNITNNNLQKLFDIRASATTFYFIKHKYVKHYPTLQEKKIDYIDIDYRETFVIEEYTNDEVNDIINDCKFSVFLK